MNKDAKHNETKIDSSCKISDESLANVAGGADDASYPTFEVDDLVNIICIVPGAPGGAGGLIYTMTCSARIISVSNTYMSPEKWDYEVLFLNYIDWNPEINEFGKNAANQLLDTTKTFSGETLVEHFGNR